MKTEEKLNIPKEEKRYITPELRQKLFLNILENYKVYAPHLKRLHAFLNFDSSNPIDYLVMFTAITENGNVFVLWDMPIQYSNRTTPGYRYVVKNNLYDDFFADSLKYMCKAPFSKFEEFIIDACKLSWDKASPLYWKKPENSKEFIKNLMSLSLLYKPQK